MIKLYSKNLNIYHDRYLESIASLERLLKDDGNYSEITKMASLRVVTTYIRAGGNVRIRERVQSFK